VSSDSLWVRAGKGVKMTLPATWMMLVNSLMNEALKEPSSTQDEFLRGMSCEFINQHVIFELDETECAYIRLMAYFTWRSAFGPITKITNSAEREFAKATIRSVIHDVYDQFTSYRYSPNR